MESLNRPSIKEANLLYLILGLSLLFIGQIVQSREIYTGLLITEYVIILIPNILFLKLKGYSLKKTLRLNKISLEQFFYIVFIMIFSYPIAVILNVILVSFISRFTPVIPTTIPLPTNLTEFGVGLFVMALAPGICEEVMFRGTMMDSYSEIGYKKSIIFSAFLFGIFHFNLYNFIGPTFLGIVFGIMVYKTNSLFTSIIGHTINNSIALTIGYFINKYQSEIDNMSSQSLDLPETSQLLAGFIVIGIIGIFSLGMLIILLKRIPKYQGKLNIYEYTEYIDQNKSNNFIKYIPVLVVVIVFIYVNFKYVLK